MEASDLDLVRSWRNHPDVRKFMYTTHEISAQEHSDWFAKAKRDPGVNLLIFEKCKIPLGFVNISLGRCPEVAHWGFYISPEAPRGTGRSLGFLALNYSFEVLAVHKLCGEALGFNERSIAFHRSLGFSEEGLLRDHYFDGAKFHNVVCFGLLRDEWLERIEDLEDE